jgi:hypothetical protein
MCSTYSEFSFQEMPRGKGKASQPAIGSNPWRKPKLRHSHLNGIGISQETPIRCCRGTRFRDNSRTGIAFFLSVTSFFSVFPPKWRTRQSNWEQVHTKFSLQPAELRNPSPSIRTRERIPKKIKRSKPATQEPANAPNKRVSVPPRRHLRCFPRWGCTWTVWVATLNVAAEKRTPVAARGSVLPRRRRRRHLLCFPRRGCTWAVWVATVVAKKRAHVAVRGPVLLRCRRRRLRLRHLRFFPRWGWKWTWTAVSFLEVAFLPFRQVCFCSFSPGFLRNVDALLLDGSEDIYSPLFICSHRDPMGNLQEERYFLEVLRLYRLCAA